jgi:hypothetical protein
MRSPFGSAPIRPITGRLSLTPPSSTRRTVGSPCGWPTLAGGRRAYQLALRESSWVSPRLYAGGASSGAGCQAGDKLDGDRRGDGDPRAGSEVVEDRSAESYALIEEGRACRRQRHADAGGPFSAVVRRPPGIEAPLLRNSGCRCAPQRSILHGTAAVLAAGMGGRSFPPKPPLSLLCSGGASGPPPARAIRARVARRWRLWAEGVGARAPPVGPAPAPPSWRGFGGLPARRLIAASFVC